MPKQQIPAAAIEQAIQEIAKKSGRVKGTAVRAALRTRFKQPGGVTRIYRAIRKHERESHSHSMLAARERTDLVELREQLAQALERAALAESRERDHQDFWAEKVHLLRQELKRERDKHITVNQSAEAHLRTYRELHQARVKIAELEKELERSKLQMTFHESSPDKAK